MHKLKLISCFILPLSLSGCAGGSVVTKSDRHPATAVVEKFPRLKNITLNITTQGKVVGKYRADFEVENKGNDHFKVFILTYDVSKSPEKLVDIGMSFMSSGNYFGLVSAFEAPDPELGFVSVVINDDVFSDVVKSGK